LTDKLSGVPCAVIDSPVVQRLGANATGLSRWLLKNRRTKHWMRTFYAVRALRSLKRSALRGLGERDVWQAGKSVGGVHAVEPVAEIVTRFERARAQAASEKTSSS
jgi:nitronate monooxygenase